MTEFERKVKNLSWRTRQTRGIMNHDNTYFDWNVSKPFDSKWKWKYGKDGITQNILSHKTKCYHSFAFLEAFLAAFCCLAIFLLSSLAKFSLISAIRSSMTLLAASATFLALISSISFAIRAYSLALWSSSFLKGTDFAYFFLRAFNFLASRLA